MIRRAPKADRTDADGVVFDSKAEMVWYAGLKLLERAGQIRNLRRQVKFPLAINGKPILIRSDRYPNGRACSYTADAVYLDVANNETWPLSETVEEFKPFFTDESRLRIAVAEAIYGFRVKIAGGGKLRSQKRRPPCAP